MHTAGSRFLSGLMENNTKPANVWWASSDKRNLKKIQTSNDILPHMLACILKVEQRSHPTKIFPHSYCLLCKTFTVPLLHFSEIRPLKKLVNGLMDCSQNKPLRFNWPALTQIQELQGKNGKEFLQTEYFLYFQPLTNHQFFRSFTWPLL